MSEHPEARCHRCKAPNVSWAAPSPLWNKVMRHLDLGGIEAYDGIVCPTCFAVLAERAGVAHGWYLSADEILTPVETVLPDGRVWNEAARLWQTPTQPAPGMASPSLPPRRVITQLARSAHAWQMHSPAGHGAEAMWRLVEQAAALIWVEAFHAGTAYQMSMTPNPIRIEVADPPGGCG